MTVFTVDEAAKYLKMPKFTIQQLAREQKIPAVKMGKQWRINKDQLDKMFASR